MIKSKYHHGNLKNTFLTIAFDFVAKEGVEKLTLKILSEATGTSRSAIYSHFKNKDELIGSIIENGFVSFNETMAPILNDKTKPLVDRFYTATRTYIKWAKNNPNLYRLLFGSSYATIRDKVINIKDENSITGFSALRQAIIEGQESGILLKEDSYQQAIIVWSSLHGLSRLIIDDFTGFEDIIEELYMAMFKSLLAGLVSNKIKLISTIPVLNNALKPSS